MNKGGINQVSGACYEIDIQPAGLRFAAPANLPLLQSAREAGVVLPSSCRNGTCRACICQKLDGTVRYAVEWPGLSREEKAEGWILPCVAFPESALVLEAPKAIDQRG